MAIRPSGLPTTVITSDTNVKAAAGRVWWITISNSHGTDSTAVEINDSTDDSGTDRWAATVEAVDILGTPAHIIFDPPIECTSGIWIDITGGTVNCTVAWT